MQAGVPLSKGEGLEVMAERCFQQLVRLPEGSLRRINPHRYKVSISRGLMQLRQQLLTEISEQLENPDIPSRLI
jgi:nicotinate phosphoribosyltransferase